MSAEIPPSRTAPADPLSLLWRLLAAPQTLMVLSGLLALCLVLGMLIPQIPPQAIEDPEAWLAVQPAVLSQPNSLINTVGLFDIYHALWFRVLLTLVGLALVVWCVEACELAWRANARGRWTSRALGWWGRYPPTIRFSAPISAESALDRIQGWLSCQGLRRVDVPGLPASTLAIDRRAQFLWAWPMLYAALLSGLIGLMISSNWGWRNPDWQASSGASQAVGHGTPYTVRLEGSAVTAGNAKMACPSRSEIVWLEGEKEIHRDSVSLGRPAALSGITVRQVDCRPAVRLSGRDEAGQPLTFQVAGEETTMTGQVGLVFSASDVQVLYLPGQDLILVLTVESSGTPGKPALSLALVQNGSTQRQPVATLQESSPVAVDGLQLQVSLDYRPVLSIARHPGMMLVMGALALAAVALATIWLAPACLVWCVVEPVAQDSTRVQLLGLPQARGSRWTAQLAEHLHRVLANDA